MTLSLDQIISARPQVRELAGLCQLLQRSLSQGDPGAILDLLTDLDSATAGLRSQITDGLRERQDPQAHAELQARLWAAHRSTVLSRRSAA